MYNVNASVPKTLVRRLEDATGLSILADGFPTEMIDAEPEEQGYEVCNQEYPSTKVSIEQLSGYLANALQLLKARGYSKVHVVTHSMGGILARHYLQGQKLPGDGRVVMLSPPNQGSEIIDEFGRFKWFEAIMGPAALQLSTQSSLLNNRLEPIQADLGIITGNRSSDPWFNFLFDQPHDGKVRVQSAKLNEMDDFVVVNRGHTRIMDAPEVLEFILNFLENASFHHEKGS